MKVYNYNQVIIETQIDFSCIISANAIDNDDSIMLPYENSNFLLSIRSLFDDVVKEMNLSWKSPDYEKSRVYFYIRGDEVSISVEVFPRYYSAMEKQAMLSTASHKEGENGWSDYLQIMCMFDDINDVLNNSCPVGEVGVYPLELTHDERELLLSIIR